MVISRHAGRNPYRWIENDPTGAVYGIATWRWGCAPAEYATRRQLKARGLSPYQPPAGQILRARVRKPHDPLWAHLFLIEAARPSRPATPAQRAALEKAAAARRTCDGCGRDAGYVVPARDRLCGECAIPNAA